MEKIFDVAIIGAGAAGLSTAIHCANLSMSVIIFEKSLVGGNTNRVKHLSNYPGFPNGIDGTELMNLFYTQAKNYGVSFKLANVKSITNKDNIIETVTEKNIFYSKTSVIATGISPILTGAINEEIFLYDNGLYPVMAPDHILFSEHTVILSNSFPLIYEILQLNHTNKKVSILYTGEKNRMLPNISEKYDLYTNIQILEFQGDVSLEKIVFKNNINGETLTLETDCCLISCGYTPNNSFLSDINQNEDGFILVDEGLMTNVKGIFAVGDITSSLPLKMVSRSSGDGASVSHRIKRVLSDLN